MTALQTQILSVTLSSSFCRPPLCIFISLSGWMSLILRWLETKADFLTEVHFLLRLTRGIEIQPLLPVLLQFFTLWPLPFLYFPLSSPCSHVLTRQDLKRHSGQKTWYSFTILSLKKRKQLVLISGAVPDSIVGFAHS